MSGRGGASRERARFLSNADLRAALLPPLLLVASPVVLCLVLGERPGSDLNDVAWAFWIIPLSALMSFLATVGIAMTRQRRTADRLSTAFFGLLGSGTALAFGLALCTQSAEFPWPPTR